MVLFGIWPVLCWDPSCEYADTMLSGAGPAGSMGARGATPPSVTNNMPSNVELSPGGLLPPLTALSSSHTGLMSPTTEVRPLLSL